LRKITTRPFSLITELLSLAAEREAAAHLLSHFPGIELTIDDYLRQRDEQQDKLWPTVPLLPGVARLVRHLHRHRIPMAIATGSRRRTFTLKISGHPEIFDLFEGKMACADDGAVPPGRGKPYPDIYLFAARELLGRAVGSPSAEAHGEVNESERVERAKGLVFEDAIPGMQAGYRAGMQVVWVPDENLLKVPYTGVERATQTLRSLEEFKPEEWGLPPYSGDV
jgi:pseudouridine 5'-phosphatase